MSDWNHDVLAQNIKKLKEKYKLSQEQLAGIAGMTQPNLSKALNPDDPRCFTLEQVVSFSQHFGVSIDELVGNNSPNDATTSPRAIFEVIIKLLSTANMRATTATIEEWVYEPFYDCEGHPDCRPEKKNIKYPAFYLPDYFSLDDFSSSEPEREDTHDEFLCGGNHTKLQRVNSILKDLIPIVRLYRNKVIAEEPFQMIIKGYLDQLPEK